MTRTEELIYEREFYNQKNLIPELLSITHADIVSLFDNSLCEDIVDEEIECGTRTAYVSGWCETESRTTYEMIDNIKHEDTEVWITDFSVTIFMYDDFGKEYKAVLEFDQSSPILIH